MSDATPPVAPVPVAVDVALELGIGAGVTPPGLLLEEMVVEPTDVAGDVVTSGILPLSLPHPDASKSRVAVTDGRGEFLEPAADARANEEIDQTMFGAMR